MKRLYAVVALLPLLALAGPNGGPNGNGRGGPEGRRGPDQARMMKVVAIADALELNEAEALKVGEVMRRFDERRQPIHRQVKDASQLVERAAAGDQSALGQVDGAIQAVLDARVQLAQLDKELVNELSRGLSPEKRARLAVTLARLNRQGQLRRSIRGEGLDDEAGPRRGGRRGQRWQQGGGDELP